jgi:hypothetical protein
METNTAWCVRGESGGKAPATTLYPIFPGLKPRASRFRAFSPGQVTLASTFNQPR